MSSSSSSSLSTSTSSSERPRVRHLSPGSVPLEVGGSSALLAKFKQWHDVDSVVTGEFLGELRTRYWIPEGYTLSAPRPGQRPYDQFPGGFGLTAGALEAGLRFPLHPVIEDCLRKWGISPSQMAPNSWRYLVVFLGECRAAGVDPSRDLFLTCFRLCRGRGGYYLSARSGFRISGAPSSNKGWKSRFFFVSCSRGWGFSTGWTSRTVDNVLPLLSGRESAELDRLRGILSSSRMIKEMTEEWLAGVGLSPVAGGMMFFMLRVTIRLGAPDRTFFFAEMVDLQSVKKASQGRSSVAAPPGGGGSGVGPKRGAPEGGSGSPGEKRPAKKLKTAVRKVSARSAARERNPAGSVPPGEASGATKGKEAAGSAGGDPVPGASQRPKSMRDLCRVGGSAGEEYRTPGMTCLPMGAAGAPYVPRWSALKADSRVWADGAVAQEFIRGALHPLLAKELYGLTLEVLADRAAKSLVWGQHYAMALLDRALDAGRVVERQANAFAALRLENEELKRSSGPEAVAAAEQRA
uniref:Transposase (putative) gypsy type domain-containing protein n=1 Tax=Musa acuminata subsp. malaccensis TaxID=214687 RepID=A0A804J724_MUSAM